MRIPTYHDGKPTNLQAAILDAEYWLRWLRSQINEQLPPAELNEYRLRLRPELIEKLRAAIQTLEGLLPDEELWGPGPSEITNSTLTPVQQVEVDLIKARLRARQEKMKATE